MHMDKPRNRAFPSLQPVYSLLSPERVSSKDPVCMVLPCSTYGIEPPSSQWNQLPTSNLTALLGSRHHAKRNVCACANVYSLLISHSDPGTWRCCFILSRSQVSLREVKWFAEVMKLVSKALPSKNCVPVLKEVSSGEKPKVRPALSKPYKLS